MVTAKHDVAPYQGHRILYIVGFAVSTILFALFALIAAQGHVTGWEYTWFMSVNTWSEAWYRPMTIITFFGGSIAAIIAVVSAFLLRFYRLAWRLAFSILGAYAAAGVAKHIIGRERPLGLLQDIHVRIAETGMGFPSGHATIITVIMLTLLPYMSWKWRWIIPLTIGLVGLSRLYLGVHIPLDILGGVALGTMVVAFVRVLPQSLRVLLRID